MGKSNLLVDRLSLVGVSKEQRTSLAPADDDHFVMKHRSLRKSYDVGVVYNSTGVQDPKYYLDFFRAAGARYWSFRNGTTSADYGDFGYLNETSYYPGHSDDQERLNDNNLDHYIGFRIGNILAGSGVEQVNNSALGMHNGSMAPYEWNDPEYGDTSQPPMAFMATAPPGAYLYEPLGVAPGFLDMPDDIRHRFGYPINQNDARASWPDHYLRWDSDCSGPDAPSTCVDGMAGTTTPVWRRGTPDMTALSEKQLITVSPDQLSWATAANAGGAYGLVNLHPTNIIDAAAAAGALNWAKYFGIAAQPTNTTLPNYSPNTPAVVQRGGVPGDWFATEWCNIDTSQLYDYRFTDNNGEYPGFMGCHVDYLNSYDNDPIDIFPVPGAYGYPRWQSDVPLAVPQFFKDHAHEFTTPYGIDDPINKLAGIQIKTAKIEPMYNYLAKNYELTISKLNANEEPIYDERLLPNAYMIYNYIDYNENSVPTPAPGTELAAPMTNTYKKLNCLHGSFGLPTSYLQISQTGYGLPGYPRTSYLQKFTAVDLASVDVAEIKNLNTHIGFSKEMMEADFIRYGSASRDAFPFGIAIEFDTKLPTSPEGTTLIDKLEAFDEQTSPVIGAIDFITNNIILMNLGDWGDYLAVAEGVPEDYFTENLRFCAKVTEQKPDTDGDGEPDEGLWNGDPSLLTPVSTYYGFDWLGSSQSGVINDTTVSYDLPCLDVANMLDYANISRLLGGYTYGNAPAWDFVAHDIRNCWSVPSPLVGQTFGLGIGRGKGVLVGPKNMNQTSLTDDASAAGGEIDLGPAAYTAAAAYRTTHRSPAINNELPSITQKIANAFVETIDEESRTYLEMINGEKAYCETLAFKIDKHKITIDPASLAETVAATPIQSFYFPNVSALDKIRYVDTQVKYGVKYKYKIYAYNLVIGNQYSYQNIPSGPNGGPGAWEYSAWNGMRNKQFYAHQFISAKIIETPYFEFEPAEVRDLPPVFPEIETVPFKGINSKIRFLMQTQNVKYSFIPEKYIINENPVPPDPHSDTEKYTFQRGFQQRPNLNEPIVFGSDDTEITFEVYRRTEKPTSYKDFAGVPHASIEGILPTGQRAVNLGWDDNIEPNTKYYYTFRCIDYHGGLSIPSPIYQVEIVDDNGRMFPVVEVFYISNHVDTAPTSSRTMRKYLHVGAAFAQKIISDTTINPDAPTTEPSLDSAIPPDSILGLNPAIAVDNSAWSVLDYANGTGTKTAFKIRLTSKSTGKKLDLNVRLEEQPTINPDEQS